MVGQKVYWNDLDNKLNENAIRPFVVLDLEKGSRVIPMAAESDKGGEMEIYKALTTAIDPTQNLIPTYPVDGTPNYKDLSDDYWIKLSDAFDSLQAMIVVEASTKTGGKLDWIDYRLIGFTGTEVIRWHLHLSPRGDYPTGTFAYQIIRRAWKYGIRILGTLKKGHDINVIAIYDC